MIHNKERVRVNALLSPFLVYYYTSTYSTLISIYSYLGVAVSSTKWVHIYFKLGRSVPIESVWVRGESGPEMRVLFFFSLFGQNEKYKLRHMNEHKLISISKETPHFLFRFLHSITTQNNCSTSHHLPCLPRYSFKLVRKDHRLCFSPRTLPTFFLSPFSFSHTISAFL